MPLNFRVPVMKPRIRPKSVTLGYTSLEQKIRECLNQEEDKIYF